MIASAIFPRERVTVVGVLNATPDSFSDGGRLVDDAGAVDLDAAVAVAARMVEAGAQMIDVGGESTRPGAMQTSLAIEIDQRRKQDVVPDIRGARIHQCATLLRRHLRLGESGLSD